MKRFIYLFIITAFIFAACGKKDESKKEDSKKEEAAIQQKKEDSIKAVKDKIGDTFLVLHGGSGTPQDDIIEAIQLGIVKININTELRLAFSGNLRRVLSADPEEVTPYKFLVDAKDAVGRVVGRMIKTFGSENKI